MKDEITVVIPKNLDVSSLPNTNGLKRDKFAWLLSEMYRMHNSREYSLNSYIPLYSQLLKSYLGCNYKRYIDYLISNNIIDQVMISTKNEEEVEYVPGYTSKRYRLHRSMLRGVKEYKITDTFTTKAIRRNYTSLAHTGNEPHRTMLRHARKVDIDLNQVLWWIKHKRRSGYISVTKARAYFNCARCLKKGVIFFRVSDTNGRVDTPVTNLKSELRSFLHFDGYKSLSQIDIKNSQPFLLAVALEHLRSPLPLSSPAISTPLCGILLAEEKELLEAAIRGSFYEELILCYNNRNNVKLDRDGAKEATMRVLYSHNRAMDLNKSAFRDAYPNIYGYIRDWKSGEHNRLAIDLQKLESDLMIKGVAGELVDKYDFPFLTVHDSVIFPTEFTDTVRGVIDEVFEKEVSHAPPVTVERLN